MRWPLCSYFVLLSEPRKTFSLIISQDHRLPVEIIKTHPFFAGVDWEAIRHIGAPFVPHLRSITDTSYFPTEELENVPDQPVGADTSGAHKDLAFVGYAICRPQLTPVFLREQKCTGTLSRDSWAILGLCDFAFIFRLSCPHSFYTTFIRSATFMMMVVIVIRHPL